MGLFNKPTEEEKVEKKQQEKELMLEKIKQKYELDNLDSKDLRMIFKIESDLNHNELMTLLSGAKAEEKVKIYYLAALVKQNWIIIRKLNEINTKLEKSQ